jgi:hypothetical protein
MLIKSICDGCIFQHVPGCELGKEVFIENTRQFTRGFCGHRRDRKWLERLLVSDPDFSESKMFDYAQGEHLTLSILISCLDANLDDLDKTLDSIQTNLHCFRQIVVTTQNVPYDVQAQIGEKIKNKCHIGWATDNIKRDDFITDLIAINYSSKFISNLWFLSIRAGDTIGENTIKEFYDNIVPVRNNLIGFYFDENDPVKNIAHTGAFKIMEGHLEQPWLEKVKQFENWKDVCKKIS